MGFEEIPIFEQNNKPSEKEVKKDEQDTVPKKEAEQMTRRAFIKGAIGGGVATGVTLEANRHGYLKKGLDALSSVFEKFQNRDKSEEKPDEEKSKNIEIQNIADHYLKAFETLKVKEEYFPKDIFTPNLLIAQQMQESNFKSDAESHVGALGIMQNMEVSIEDDALFLEKLHKAEVLEYDGPICINNLKREKKKLQKENNPSQKEAARIDQIDRIIIAKKEKYGDRILKDSDMIAIKLLLVDNPDYSKALGKLYHMRLHHKKYGYSIGQEEYAKGDIKKAQTKILGAYNAGANHVRNKSKDEWWDEPRNYVNNIFNYIQRLENVRESMEEHEINPKNDAIAMRTAREMNKVRGRGETRRRLLNETMNDIMNEIQQLETAKGSKLDEKEIIEFFSRFKDVADIKKDIPLIAKN